MGREQGTQLLEELLQTLGDHVAVRVLGDGRVVRDVADDHRHLGQDDAHRRLPRVHGAAAQEALGPKCEVHLSDGDAVAGADGNWHGPFDARAVQPRPVGTGVDEVGLVLFGVEAHLDVVSRDLRVVNQQSVFVVDARAFPPDEDAVVDGDVPLVAASRVHDDERLRCRGPLRRHLLTLGAPGHGAAACTLWGRRRLPHCRPPNPATRPPSAPTRMATTTVAMTGSLAAPSHTPATAAKPKSPPRSVRAMLPETRRRPRRMPLRTEPG